MSHNIIAVHRSDTKFVEGYYGWALFRYRFGTGTLWLSIILILICNKHIIMSIIRIPNRYTHIMVGHRFNTNLVQAYYSWASSKTKLYTGIFWLSNFRYQSLRHIMAEHHFDTDLVPARCGRRTRSLDIKTSTARWSSFMWTCFMFNICLLLHH